MCHIITRTHLREARFEVRRSAGLLEEQGDDRRVPGLCGSCSTHRGEELWTTQPEATFTPARARRPTNSRWRMRGFGWGLVWRSARETATETAGTAPTCSGRRRTVQRGVILGPAPARVCIQ